MIKKLFSFLGKAGKTAKTTIDKSTEFIDDALDSEYITGSIDKAKDATGKVVEKAGEYYAKGKFKAEEILEDERFQGIKEKAEDFIDKTEEIFSNGNEEE